MLKMTKITYSSVIFLKLIIYESEMLKQVFNQSLKCIDFYYACYMNKVSGKHSEMS